LAPELPADGEQHRGERDPSDRRRGAERRHDAGEVGDGEPPRHRACSPERRGQQQRAERHQDEPGADHGDHPAGIVVDEVDERVPGLDRQAPGSVAYAYSTPSAEAPAMNASAPRDAATAPAVAQAAPR
jgi:hypothetical protein